ncbi:hypothetical protein CEE45_00515 [Candidatus Heimdallarchaeota archaeon B3_Heim]|nr:MAG: hypothetical protein CEE45_00515 [Candidatus Heimdallarchaeota archaeon B3_Heim]
MRETFVKTSRGLLTLTVIGIFSIVLGFFYYSGVASADRLLIGLDYKILFAFGFYLTIITALPSLSVMDARGKMSVKKIYPHLILLFSISILGIIYSLLVYGGFVTAIDTEITIWFDYFILSGVVFCVSLLPLLFGVRDRERLWNLKFLYLSLIAIGLILEIASMLAYGHYIDDLLTAIPLIGGTSWDVLFLSGGIFLILGVFPSLISASQRFRSFLDNTRILWLIGVVIGFVIVLLSLLIRIDILESSLVLDTEWYVLYSFGSLLLLSTAAFLSSSRKFSGILDKLKLVWFLTLLIGFFMALMSFMLVLSSSSQVQELLNLSNLDYTFLGYSWDVMFMYGTMFSLVSMIFITSVLYFETEEVSGDFQTSDISTDSFLDLKTTPTEMVTYLDILSKNESNLINQFKEALRDDKFRPRVYESLVKHYEGRIKSYKTKIGSLRKAKPGTPEADKVGALFDSVLGETPSPKAIPKVPSVQSQPVGLPTSPPPPPSTPPVTSPPMPSASVPPPSPTVPEPVMPTGQASDSPLDLIADARSTSIAELRGEMLKELRRLREIFKEE